MKGLIIFLVLISVNLSIAFGESEKIMITLSDTMDQINFDGKWTFVTEWKRSSQYLFDGGNIIFRTAHQGDFIYVFIDNLSDTTTDNKSDYATVCIDGKNDKSLFPDDNDYCFRATIGEINGLGYTGGLSDDNNFRKITSEAEFIAVGGESDDNDRYSESIHSSYEFKIPVELFGRDHTYGFYFDVYDSEEGKIFQWPNSVKGDNMDGIPSPSGWGELISPDKSLPEFPLSLPILIISTIIIVGISKRVRFYK